MARAVRLTAMVASAMALLVTPASALAQAPAPDAVPGELIVRFKSSVGESQRENVRDRVGADLEERLPVKGLELVDLDAGVSLAAAERAFERQSGVLYAEPNYYRRAEAAASDALFGQLWGLDNTGQSVRGFAGSVDADIDAPEAWGLTTGHPGVKVAIVDTGVAYDHPDLAPNVWTNTLEASGLSGVDDDGNGQKDDVRGYDFANGDSDPRDQNGHGTHVAGTVGGRGNDGYGVAGVAWDVTLIPVQVLGADGSGSVSNVIKGYEYAARSGAKVVNASLGGSQLTQAERDTIAATTGVLFVVAAGNDGRSNDVTPQYPCNYGSANLICVAASDQSDGLPSFSNFGATSVDLAAPGKSTLSSYARCADLSFPYSQAYLSGTSMATPHVAGAAALVLSRYRTATVSQLRERLLASVDSKAALAGKTATGGRLNANRALTYSSVATVSPVTAQEARPAPQAVAEPDCLAAPAPQAPPATPATPASVTVPPPVAPPAPAARVDATTPRLSVSVARGQTLRRVISGGVQSRVRCSEACRISTRALVDARTARRLKLTPIVGRGMTGLPSAGGKTVAVKLTSAAKRRLARARLVTLTLRTVGVNRAGNARTVTSRVRLKR